MEEGIYRPVNGPSLQKKETSLYCRNSVADFQITALSLAKPIFSIPSLLYETVLSYFQLQTFWYRFLSGLEKLRKFYCSLVKLDNFICL